MALTTAFGPTMGPHPARSRSRPGSMRALAMLSAITLSLTGPSSALAQANPPAVEPPKSSLVSFGEYLFRSPLFSRDASVSCQTCHVPALGFSGNRPLATGVAGYTSPRRAPSLFGLRETKALMWDGRAPDLRAQAAIPLESPEMATNWPIALSRLHEDPTAVELARQAGLAAIDRDASLTALAAYVASLEASPSRFDRYYQDRESNILTAQEIWGLRLFVRKARCANCHLVDSRSAPLTDNAFHATGIGRVAGSYKDRGRAAITGNPDDEGAFRTPSLRGVALRPYLMHDGSITSLRQAVEHYNLGISDRPSRADDRLAPLHLTSDEIDAIVAFLETLTPDRSISAPSAGTVR